MIEIRLPKPGPEIENATITRWQCNEGDKIQIGDILAIIKTPIGSFKVAAEEQGILENILQGAGASIDFDEPIAIMHPELTITDFPDLSLEGDATLPLAIEDAEPEAPQEAEHRGSDESVDEPEPETDAELELTTPEPMPATEVSPAARKMADRMGIDVSSISGTGDNGKVLYIDVENAIQVRELPTATLSTESAPEDPVEAEDPVAESEADSPDGDMEEAYADSDDASTVDFLPTLTPLITPMQDIDGDADAAETHLEDREAPTAQDEPEPMPDGTSMPASPATPDPSETTPASEVPSLQAADSRGLLDTTAEMESLPRTDPPDLPITHFGEVASQFNLSKRDDLIIPFNSSKRTFADNQLESNRSVPHFYLVAEVDWTDALNWLKEQHQRTVIKVQLTDLVVKATGHALAMMPEMNAFVRNDRMILKRSVNIGVTTAVDDGVVTPVIPDVFHKSLEKVAEVVKKNTDLAVRSKVVLDYDTTFTVTVIDDERISRVVPLITAPQTGCLAMGAIHKQVVPFGDFIAIRSCSELTLACDSRAMDPTNAAHFLQSICKALELLKPGEPDPDWTHGNEQLRLI